MTTPRDRNEKGALAPADALARFAAKCKFDPTTGCLIWTGATSAGRGNTARYGSFKFKGRRWAAQRWAGVYIHNLDLEGRQAGHCCPHGPNTLCVEHIAGQTQRENLEEQMARGSGVCAHQSNEDRLHWLLVQLGYEQPEERAKPAADLPPVYDPPEWFRPFMEEPANDAPDACPF